MSKYIIELFDGVQVLTGVGASPSGTVWSKSYDVDELEELNSDYINEHYGELQEEAYQRGLEDGKKSGYEKGLNAVGTYRKGHEIGYDEGYEDGKNSYDKNKTYQRGLEDAWEAAKKIFGYEIDGGIPIDKIGRVFGYPENETFCTADIIRHNTASEAIAKLKAYEDKHSDRIEVGDEVATKTGKKYTAVSFGYGGTVCGFDKEGMWTGWNPKEVTKTGKHYDIASILEAMRTHD